MWLENGSRFIHATSADSTDQQSANSANSAFTTNSWMHVVMLLDRFNGTIRAFKNKVLVANDIIRTTDTVSSQNPLLLGPAKRVIPISATLTDSWMISGFTTAFFTPLKLITYTMQ